MNIANTMAACSAGDQNKDGTRKWRRTEIRHEHSNKLDGSELSACARKNNGLKRITKHKQNEMSRRSELDMDLDELGPFQEERLQYYNNINNNNNWHWCCLEMRRWTGSPCNRLAARQTAQIPVLFVMTTDGTRCSFTPQGFQWKLGISHSHTCTSARSRLLNNIL